MSDALAGVSGERVAVLPWGNHLALFATDVSGVVMCAGCYPESGLMGPWAEISDSFTGIPGAPVTVLPWGNHFALFATDVSGIVMCAGGDPQNGIMGPWAPISDSFTGIPGAPVAVQPWGNHFALFATDVSGIVMCAGGDPQNGIMGPWAQVSEDFAGPPGAVVTAVPWNGAFAVCAVDSAGAVRTASGDPQNNLSDWTPASGLTTRAGSAATIVAAGSGVDLFAVDTAGACWGTVGGVAVMTAFTPGEHGWHFSNYFENELLGGLITTHGLCGGMAYTSLDYYFKGIPIPTHRVGDFGDMSVLVPGDGRLHSMIYNRLIDSFKDNFGKWSCVYPDLDAAVAAALGLVIGGAGGGILGGILGGALGGVLGGLIGAGGGWVYGELHELFECPGGGAGGMTKQELPHLIKDFLDQGTPVPLGLIYDRDILNIGHSHQVVAYGYMVVGSQTRIYVYDNRMNDTECILTVDTENPGEVLQTLADGSPLPDDNNGKWEGFLVEDGYTAQAPSYGQDISIASPQAITLDGKPVFTAPTVPGGGIMARLSAGPAAGLPERAMPLVSAALEFLPPGLRLTDSFTVQNLGEYQAHYQSLGIEIDPPSGGAGYHDAPAPQADNVLASGDTVPVTIQVIPFGDTPGRYYVKAGYNSVPLNGEASYWLLPLALPTSLTVT